MKNSTVLLLCILVFLIGCNEHGPSPQQPPQATANDTVRIDTIITIGKSVAPPYRGSILRIESYTRIPDTLISGCNDIFAVDSGLTQYLFVSNLMDGYAAIKVDGRMIYLMRDTTVKSTSKEIYSKSFEGNGYRAVFKVRMIRAYDEGGEFKGTIEITHEGRSETIDIIGESGC